MSRKSPKAPPAAIARPARKAADAIADVTAASAAALAAPEPLPMPDTLAAATALGAAQIGDAVVHAPVTIEPVAETAVEAVAQTVEPVVEAVQTAGEQVQVRTIKAAESVVTAAEDAASTVQKDVNQMATQFETTQTMNTMTDSTKSAVEKGQKFVAEMGEFGKGNLEAMVEAGKITAKGFETLGQDYADFTRRSFEGLTATMRSFASVKSPTELLKLQSDYARQAFDQAVAQSSKNTEAMIKLASDAAQPLSNRFAVAVEKVKTAA